MFNLLKVLPIVPVFLAIILLGAYGPSTLKQEGQAAAPIVEQSPALNPDDINAWVAAEESQSSDINGATETATYRLEDDTSLKAFWDEIGAAKSELSKISEVFRSLGLKPEDLRRDQEFELTISQDKQLKALKYHFEDGKILEVSAQGSLGYSASLQKPQISESIRTVSGTISSSFVAAARQASLPQQTADELVDLFSSRIEFRKDLRPGDTFSVTYLERSLASGKLLRPGEIRRASIRCQGQIHAAIRYEPKPGQSYFFDERGDRIGKYFLRYPVQFSHISSVVTDSRLHPVLKVKRPHNGIDFAAPTGTPVRAVADGIVEFGGYNGAAGNMLRVKHSDRYETAYLHLAHISRGIRKGSVVKQGQVIGTVGRTGLATGPHLHFSLFDHGRYVNPLKAALPAIDYGSNPIPKAYLRAQMQLIEHEHELVLVAYAQTGRSVRMVS